MTRRSVVAICAVTLTARAAFAVGALPEPVSYTKPLANSKYLYVMLGDPDAETKQSTSAQREFRELRNRYPRSGLYHADTGELIWSIDADYAPYDNTFITSDGVYLMRLEGEWWVERDYPSPSKRLSREEEQNQFESEAVSFFADGKPIRSYKLRDIVTTPLDLKHSPRFVLWAAGGVLNESDGRFVVMTQDATRIVFDYRTGERVATDRIGLNNPILGRILVTCGVMSGAILAVWAWFAWRTRPQG